MTLIDSSSALMALVRSQLATQRTSAQPIALNQTSAAQPVKGSTAQSQNRAQHKKLSDTDLRLWVVDQVRHLSADDPHNRSKAFRIFLKTIFEQEFGSNLAGDDCDQLLSLVLVQMEGDADLVLAMDQAGHQLLIEAGVLKVD